MARSGYYWPFNSNWFGNLFNWRDESYEYRRINAYIWIWSVKFKLKIALRKKNKQIKTIPMTHTKNGAQFSFISQTIRIEFLVHFYHHHNNTILSVQSHFQPFQFHCVYFMCICSAQIIMSLIHFNYIENVHNIVHNMISCLHLEYHQWVFFCGEKNK